MKALVVDDDPVTRKRVQGSLEAGGHQVACASNGEEGWALLRDGSFDVIVLDWMMPGIEGPELCRRLRATFDLPFTYVIMLTSRSTKEDVVAGIEAGADDFLTKPWHAGELTARIHAAERIIELERGMRQRLDELESALSEVHALRGLLPVCMYCKNIRRGDEKWQEIIAYISTHSDADFTHSICPTCYERWVQPEIDGMTP